MCTHTATCHPAPENVTNEDSPSDNVNIVLASLKIGGERGTTKAATTNSNTVAAATLGVNLRYLLQRDHSKCRGPW